MDKLLELEKRLAMVVADLNLCLTQCASLSKELVNLASTVERRQAEHEKAIAAISQRVAAAEECCHRAERIVKGIK